MKYTLMIAAVSLSGCGFLPENRAPELSGNPDTTVRPQTRPDITTAIPSSNARTAEQFDTATPAERAAATQSKPESETRLGMTVASLGAPAKPGFWLETPLVETPSSGRVTYAATGKSVQVSLLPIDGPDTAGSRMSLSALRLLGVPLTSLPEVEVFLAR